ncbi:nitrate reductase (NADPH) [Sporothrix schenckii 1099-18]|uniref:Nitrate reductase n=1 Tax=Sporothrix schenckii 1099-18 TaxID=1397361 RepID=A0A0F2LZF4_SPOSC|nr:nitrate reductase (NADPH) [Sporothrix schenckii 1099-18]KJR81880.1 nitrate reductase (NADPH) [Sporothrix schenckii 1099-18]
MSTTTKLLSPLAGPLIDTKSFPFQSKHNYLHAVEGSLLDIPLPPSGSPVTEVLDKDKGTPDNHVTRDSRLIRLTGVHPFNAEAPLTALYREGFITSVDLFYVRNHGPVPQILDNEIWSWELSVEGLVENPLTISLKQLVEEFEQITLPVTLVCAGNRRKEQNTVRKSKGFSWGPAGLSTALFTGTLMANILQRAKPMRRAKFVCMEGADNLPNGHYGTSVKLNWAMDPNRGLMLAHGMNGAPLRADHGRPLRAVVPGQIGGRSVKWLRRLIVTAEPSDNWYHYYDNKVLPTTVTPQQSADEPAWWRDERYAIYDLNVNSAIAQPQHDEVLDLASRVPDYTIRGYAYSGGGRRVTRMEVSLDGGNSWRLADVQYPEDRYRDIDIDLYGGRLDMSSRDTCFCWCFWAYTLPIYELQSADSIIVRGMDDAMMCQPRDMYWSVLGMMNNPWFRVTIVKTGKQTLRFEHPTSLMSGNPGWMEKVKKAGGDLLNGRWGEISSKDIHQPPTPPLEEVNMANSDVKRIFTFNEFSEQSSEARPLFVVAGEVYDGTGYLKHHPGGAQSIQAVAASDATEEFIAIHSENAKRMLRDYHIGSLDDRGRQVLRDQGGTEKSLSPTRAIFLDSRHWAKAILSKITPVSSDTKVFTFILDHDNQEVGLPTGQHLMLRYTDTENEETILRAYTPVSENTRKGTLELLVKLYLPTLTSPGGRMTTALNKVPIGTALEFKGPVGKFEYVGRGVASIGGEKRPVSSFVMICGGSGITPILQVLRAVACDADDTIPFTLLDGNRNEQDILCRQELDNLHLLSQRKTTDSGRYKVIHTLTCPPTGWTGLCGRISERLLRKEAVPAENRLALVCGPPAMENFVRDTLGRMDWKESDVVFF